MRLDGYISDKEPIRPVVYGVGLYFLLSGTDSFQIGTIGSFLKIAALLPLALALLDLAYRAPGKQLLQEHHINVLRNAEHLKKIQNRFELKP